jgi:DedD protein
MDTRVRERLIGALVLVAIVVLVVPAILQGRDPAPPAGTPQPARRVVVPAGASGPAAPEEEDLVPEPRLPEMAAAPDSANRDEPAGARRAARVEESESRQAQAAQRETPRPAPKEPAPRPTPAPAASVAAGQAPAWAVQLGAFAGREKADGLVAALKERGYAAFVLEYRAAGKVLYRVRVGPEQDRARAAAVAERLAKDGFDPVVARHP